MATQTTSSAVGGFDRVTVLFLNQIVFEYEHSPQFRIYPQALIARLHEYNPKINIQMIAAPKIDEVEDTGAILASQIEHIKTTRGKYVFWTAA